MANLFCVYTPFQFYVAQAIVIQEKLENNILLMGYVADSSHFLDIYKILKIDGCWSDEILMTNISSWLNIDLYHPIKSILKIHKDYSSIKTHLKKYDIDSIYLGDINNYTERMMAQVLSKRRVRISFFEEGASHYGERMVGGLLSHKPFIATLYQTFFDWFLYLPLFKQRMGYSTFVKAAPLADIPIDSRYSIIPNFHESFDKRVYCRGLVSPRVSNLIKDECKNINTSNSVLFLEQPIYELVKDSISCYIQTIKDYFLQLHEDITIVIKYHPRETKEIKNTIENLFVSLGRKYIVISKEVNLPIEFYMEQIKFKHVVNFITSSAFYNGYLFDEVEFIYLIEEFYNNCKDAQLPEYKNLDNIMELYKKQLVK